MKSVSLLYLTQETVMELGLDIRDIIPIVEDVLKEHGEGNLEIPPKPGIHPRKNTFIHAMPGYIPNINVSGIKWVSGYPNNYKLNLPQIMGILVLNDVETGAPLAIMDSRWITAVRTAVTTAVTAKYAAKENSTTLGIIGAGVQGKFHAVSLKEVLPNLTTIKIYDVSESAMDSYVDLISKKTGLNVKKAASYKETVIDSDVVITATQRLEESIIEYDWLKEGVLGIGLESGRAWGKSILKMDKFITDDWKQTSQFAKTGAFPKGIENMYLEIGKYIHQHKAIRRNDNEKIIACNVGISAADLAIGDTIYKLALKNKKGIELPLMESENILT